MKSKEKKILHIDDEEIARNEFSQIFNGTDYKLEFAVNSIDGLEKIQQNNYDLILLDIIMPDLNNRQNIMAGLELLKKIKEKNANIPVIMLSVKTHMSTANEAFRMGAVDYIIKDKIKSDEELLRKVKNTLNHFEALAQSRDFVSHLINQGESKTMEFKSSLRWNFKAQKNDKKIKKSWLKTIVAFLNTDGGILLVGVEDDGEIIGIEHDKFPCDDKLLVYFSNQIERHIGLEFSKFIKFELESIVDKKVLFVECKKSFEPAFLKLNEEEEDFYIRVGPTSKKLSTKAAWYHLKDIQR